MKEETQKTLGDLYAIRATMSLVAQNDDHSEEEKRAIRASDSTLGRLNDEMEKEKQERKRRLDEYDLDVLLQNAEQNSRDAHHKEEYAQQEMKREEKKKKELRRDSAISFRNYFASILWYEPKVLGGAVAVYFILFALAIFLNNLFLESPAVIYPLTIFSPLADLMIVHTFYFFIHFGGEWAKYKEYLRNDYTKACEFLAQSTEAAKEAENQVAHYRAELEAGKKYTSNESTKAIKKASREWADSVLEQIKEAQAKRLPHTESVTALAAQSKALVDSAVKAYPVIDFRDWGNVDLLIYYFETGRADSVKEALQLVDRQRQTDQITQALEMASAEINRTIHQSMVQLGSALVQSFSVLSSQLAAQHNELMQGMEEQAAQQRAKIGEQTAAIERQSAMQVSAQEMNTALLNKISTSSGRLATQMDRQLKEAYNVTVY